MWTNGHRTNVMIIALSVFVLASALVIGGCTSSTAPSSTPTATTYPMYDLTPGSTWQYEVTGQITNPDTGQKTNVTMTMNVTVESTSSDFFPGAVRLKQSTSTTDSYVAYQYVKEASGNTEELGDEEYTVSGTTETLMSRSINGSPLATPVNLKVGDVVNQSVPVTSTNYNPDGSEAGTTTGTSKTDFTVSAIETVTVKAGTFTAIKETEPSGATMWVGPNGVGVIKRTSSGGMQYELVSYTLK